MCNEEMINVMKQCGVMCNNINEENQWNSNNE